MGRDQESAVRPLGVGCVAARKRSRAGGLEIEDTDVWLAGVLVALIFSFQSGEFVHFALKLFERYFGPRIVERF